MQVQSLGWEDPLEKEMETHASILAWKIPWTEEAGGLQSKGLKKSWTYLPAYSSVPGIPKCIKLQPLVSRSSPPTRCNKQGNKQMPYRIKPVHKHRSVISSVGIHPETISEAFTEYESLRYKVPEVQLSRALKKKHHFTIIGVSCCTP